MGRLSRQLVMALALWLALGHGAQARLAVVKGKLTDPEE